ncbi:MAG: O-antigen ligase family protein [Pirellulaceae bacterium]
MTRRAHKSARRPTKNDAGVGHDRRVAATGDLSEGDRFRPVWLFLLSALLVATPLLPSETAAREGTGVLLITLWLAFLVAWLASAAWYGRLEIRNGSLVVLLLLMVTCHSASALVMGQYGQPRYSFNMLWQWVSLGASCFLALQVVRKGVECRAFAAVAIALAVCLSSHGYYQYFYSLPKTRSAFAENPEEELRKAEVIAPPGSVERKQFEDRLQSTEPFATFTLANSLAALLSPWLLVVVGITATNAASLRGDLVRWSVALVTTAIIVGCWVLTKSRAAWLAAWVGLALLALHGWRAGWWRPNGKVLAGAAAAVILSVVFGTVTGALDLLVLSEAAKSFLYRTEYWQATLAMIRDYPWFGCGPGNFQQYYTAYKLPAASETIADPHNFFLEVWATAGSPAMIAFVALFVVFAWRVWRRRGPRGHGDANGTAASGKRKEKIDSPRGGLRSGVPAGSGDPRRTLGSFFRPFALAQTGPRRGPPISPAAGEAEGLARPVYWGAFAGFLMAFFPCGFLVGYVPDPALLLLAPIGALSIAGWHWWVAQGELRVSVLVCSIVTLLVSLTVAGGISFAGVAGSLWLLVALALVAVNGRDTARTLSRPWAVGLAVAAFALGVAFHQTMYVPVLRGPVLLMRGLQLRQAGAFNAAEAAFLSASRVDPYSAEPWLQLADMYHQRWMATGEPHAWIGFDSAVHRMLHRNKRSSPAYTQYGDWALASYRRRGDPSHLSAAQYAYQRAVDLYPNSSYGHALLAWALHLAGRTADARREAEEALRLDRLNPHSERKLAMLHITDAALEDPDAPPVDAEQLMERIRKSQE